MSGQPRTGFFVKSKELKPGDVLLTRSTDWSSKVIAYATNGPFSHAAIWLPLGRDPNRLILVESEDYGVGPTILPHGHYTTHDGDHVSGVFLTDVECAGVYRHPLIATVDPTDLAKAAEQLARAEFYLAYSELERLAEAVDRFGAFRPQIAFLLRLKEDKPRDIVPGSFCSELVSKFFELLRLPLFDPSRSPHEVSPNALAKSSLLKREEGLLTAISALSSYYISKLGPETSTHEASKPHPLSRAALLPPMVRSRSRYIRVTEQSDQTNNLAVHLYLTQLRTIADRVPQSIADCLRRAQIARQLNDRIAAERLEETAATFQIAGAVARASLKRDDLFHEATDIPMSIAAVYILMFILETYDQATSDFLRRAALLDIKFARKCVREGLSDSKRYMETMRKTWLGPWKAHLDERTHRSDWYSLLPAETLESKSIVDQVLVDSVYCLSQ